MKKITWMTFLLLFYSLKFIKTLLFCFNVSSNAILQFFFLWISSRKTKKIIYKRKTFKTSANDFFIAVLLHFYDLKNLNLTKSQLSNKKSGMVLEVTKLLNSKINIIAKFQVSIFKNDEARGGGSFFPQKREISWLRGSKFNQDLD